MSSHSNELSRRRFLKLSAVGLAAIPALSLLTQRKAYADELPMLQESDTQAQAMHYTNDATKAGDGRQANAFCHTCQLFTPVGDGTTGTCQVFPGKRVNHNGWCVAWTQKAG